MLIALNILQKIMIYPTIVTVFQPRAFPATEGGSITPCCFNKPLIGLTQHQLCSILPDLVAVSKNAA